MLSPSSNDEHTTHKPIQTLYSSCNAPRREQSMLVMAFLLLRRGTHKMMQFVNHLITRR